MEENNWDKLKMEIKKDKNIIMYNSINVIQHDNDFALLQYEDVSHKYIFPVKNKIFDYLKEHRGTTLIGNNKDFAINTARVSGRQCVLKLVKSPMFDDFILSYGLTTYDNIDKINNLEDYVIKDLV